MTDFYISAVQYDPTRRHIQKVKIRQNRGNMIGPELISDREFVANLIKETNASFKTVIWSAARELWVPGSDIHDIEGVYLTTDANKVLRDNLGELPTF